MPMARGLGIQRLHPAIECRLHLGGRAFAQLALGPVTVAVFRAFQNIQQILHRRARELGRRGELGSLG